MFDTQLVAWLNEQLELKDIPVSTLVPADRPDRFITVERTGGARGLIIDRPTLAIQVWAPTSVEAEQLATDLIDIVFPRVFDLPDVGAFDVQSLVDFPLDERTPRWQILVNAVIHTAIE